MLLIEAVRDNAGRVVDFTYLAINAAACQRIGVAEEAIIGRTLRETLPSFEESGLLQHYVTCLDSGEPVVLDGYAYEISGKTRHCDVRAGRATDDVIAISWRDATRRVVDVQRVTASEQQFRLLAQSLGEAVFRIGTDGTILWVSKSAEQYFAPAEFVVGHRLDEFVPREELADHEARLAAAGSGESVVGRARVVSVDGELHWIHFFLKPFHGADGAPDGLVLTCRIIDAEVAAEEHVEEARRLQGESDARWHRMMDNAAVGMCLSEFSGRFDVVNQAICHFFGYDQEALKTKTWQELTAPQFLHADLANVEALLSGRIESYRTVKQFIHADGHLVWGDLSVSCLRSADGHTERFIAQIVDITTEMEARRDLAQREEQNRILATRLQAQTDRLTAELRSAAAYMASILPTDLDGTVRVSSRYFASQELGGDCFDYRWIDDDHLIVYLLDVSGHGVQSALLSVSVHNLLRSGSLSGSVLMHPDRVLAELNGIFSMEKHAGNYFTMWFGVYEASTHTLTYCSGGHPPALLLTPNPEREKVTPLSTAGLPVGMFGDSEYTCGTASIAPGDSLLLYSDGAYDIVTRDGRISSVNDFTVLCGQFAGAPQWTLDTLVDHLRRLTADEWFEDDLTLVRLDFPD